MIRLLMLVQNRVGKGTYWRALGFAQELSKQDYNYEVTLVAIAPNRKRGVVEYAVKNVWVVESPDLTPRTGYDVWDTLNRLAWVNKRPFDLIHAFETRPVNIFPALHAQKQNQVPLLTDWCDWFGRGGSVEQRKNWVLKTTLRPVETFFENHFRPQTAGTTVINTILERKARALGIANDKLLMLPNGADTIGFYPKPQRPLRNHLGLPADAFILGYTGSMFHEDARLMAAAFNLIHDQFPHTRLLLAGYTNIAVEEMVADKTAVFRTGPLTYQKLADYVAACNVGWLPLADIAANRGRFPMKINDFMATGRPLIVTDVGDIGDFVRQWKLGWMATATPESMAQTVIEVIGETTVCDQIGQRARIVAETEFAWPVVSANLNRFYKQILG